MNQSENIRIEISVPETEGVEIPVSNSIKDKISIEITEVQIEVNNVSSETELRWIKTKKCIFVPGYGDFDKVLTRRILLPPNETCARNSDVLQATIRKNIMKIHSVRGFIKKVAIIITPIKK